MHSSPEIIVAMSSRQTFHGLLQLPAVAMSLCRSRHGEKLAAKSRPGHLNTRVDRTLALVSRVLCSISKIAVHIRKTNVESWSMLAVASWQPARSHGSLFEKPGECLESHRIIYVFDLRRAIVAPENRAPGQRVHVGCPGGWRTTIPLTHRRTSASFVGQSRAPNWSIELVLVGRPFQIFVRSHLRLVDQTPRTYRP